MKLFKAIFKLIFFIIFIALLGVVVLGFTCYDYNGPKFDNQNLEQYPSISDEVTSSIKNSLKSIKDNNYADEHNIVTISFKGDDECGFRSINRKIAENIEITNGYEYDGGAYKIRNILVCPYINGDYNISLRLDMEAIGFYRSTAYLYGKATYTNGKLSVLFDQYKMGPKPVAKFIIDSLPLDQLKFENEVFNMYKADDGIHCKIGIDQMMVSNIVSGANSVILQVLGLSKTVTFTENSMDFKINTKGLFSITNPISLLL